jgi:hypothetical protein
LPLLLQRVPGVPRRLVYGFAAVLAAGLTAGLRGATLPITEGRAPGLGIDGEQQPRAVADALSAALSAQPGLYREALVIGIAALALPFALRGGEITIAAFGAAFTAAALLAAPGAVAWPLALSAWVTCAALLLQWRMGGGAPADWRGFATVRSPTRAFPTVRLRPGGGPGWPRPRRIGQVRAR